MVSKGNRRKAQGLNVLFCHLECQLLDSSQEVSKPFLVKYHVGNAPSKKFLSSFWSKNMLEMLPSRTEMTRRQLKNVIRLFTTLEIT
jgi:hypothetical protein